LNFDFISGNINFEKCGRFAAGSQKQTNHRSISENGRPFSVPTQCGGLTGHQDFSFYLRYKEVKDKGILRVSKIECKKGFLNSSCSA
jgi:hypothetical protein